MPKPNGGKKKNQLKQPRPKRLGKAESNKRRKKNLVGQTWGRLMDRKEFLSDADQF